MIDYGTRQTDLAVRRAEWRLSRVYRQAQRDIDEKLKDWQKGHEEREKRYRQQLADGKITQQDFDAWMRGQVFQEKQWQARQEQIRQTLLNADREAQRIINEGKLGVFAENANYIGYGLEHGANINTGFTLYDEQTVARLIKSDPQILPKAAPGVKKDKAYTYYNKLMNSAITQGIIQGVTIPQIAKRVARVTGESSYKSAVRNARTAYTSAQNAGRIEGLHQAQQLGINVKKQWMATLDNRTRDAHADLDGQIRDIDEPFQVDGMEIDYPGDPTADPSLVYNCRCSLVYIYPDYPSDMQRRDNETGEVVGYMTYREWEEMKQGDVQEEKHETTTQQAIDDYDRQINEIDERIKNTESEYQDLMCQQMMAFGTPEYDELTRQLEEMDKAFAESYAEADRLRQGKREYLTQGAGDEIKRMFGEIDGPHSIEDDLWATNRITADDSRSYNNCGYCTLAYDSRRRGIDCKAPYIFGADDRSLSAWWKDFSFETTGQYYPQDAARTIAETAERWGPGARGIVAVDHDAGMGHYFSFEVGNDGKCRFVDAQSGISDASDAFDSASPGSVRFGRTDDKELTKAASVYIEKGGWGSDKYS